MAVCSFEHSLWHSSVRALHELDHSRWCQPCLLTARRTTADLIRYTCSSHWVVSAARGVVFLRQTRRGIKNGWMGCRVFSCCRSNGWRTKSAKDKECYKWSTETATRSQIDNEHQLKNIALNWTWLYYTDVVITWWTWASPWPLTKYVCGTSGSCTEQLDLSKTIKWLHPGDINKSNTFMSWAVNVPGLLCSPVVILLLQPIANWLSTTRPAKKKKNPAGHTHAKTYKCSTKVNCCFKCNSKWIQSMSNWNWCKFKVA